ncbi:hypothetical protein SCHPADRAFT_998331 [Schizopora paradoxa]|uniref:Uncharacterized protein n=1 Tax=Schizopora paradoxa TaxID=27342 RepID=A0A0H2RJV9_9AGAM|nr:hypothetical protein SCHPADRAFT_998331 [Schizopora paradoxa]
MIIVDTENEKANATVGVQPPTQLFFARMPEPDVSNLSNQMGSTLRISEQDAPPAYDQVANSQPQNAGSSSTQRESMLPSGSSVQAFEPLVTHSRGKRLHEGFYSMLPPTDIVPHPFLQRSISTEDWKRFLNELQECARIANNASTSSSGEPPSPNAMKNAASFFMSTFKTNQRMDRPVATSSTSSLESPSTPTDPWSLIEYWNTNVFHPRGIDIVLAKGPRRLSGDRNLPPPDYESPLIQNSAPSSPLPRPSHSMRPHPVPPVIAPHPFAGVHPCSRRRAMAASYSGRHECGSGCGRSCRPPRAASNSSTSFGSDDEGSSGRNLSTNYSPVAPPTASSSPTIIPTPHVGGGEPPSRSVPSGQNSSTTTSNPNLEAPLPDLPPERNGVVLGDVHPRAQRHIDRWAKRQERKNERFDRKLQRNYAKIEQKLEKKGFYLSPFLPVDLAMHGVGMGVGLGMRGVGMGMNMGLRGIGLGLRGVGLGMRGGKAPMSEVALADEEDGYYRLIVTDLNRV